MSGIADAINADIDARLTRFKAVAASINALDDATLRGFAETLPAAEAKYAYAMLDDIEDTNCPRLAGVPHFDAIYNRANAEMSNGDIRGRLGRLVDGTRAENAMETIAMTQPLSLTPEIFSPEEIRRLRAMLAPLGIAV